MQPTLFPQTFLSKTAHAAQHPLMQPNISCSLHYFQRLFYQKQLMQPNQIPTHAAQQKSHAPSVCSYFQRLFYQKQLMQPNCQIPTLGMHPTCSYFQRLFYQKQLMQPNCQIPTLGMQLFPTTFLSKTAHAAQLPNPHPRYAAISNDFSIKNSSCSPTAKSPPSVCSYFQRLFYQKQLMQPNCQIPTLGMQLFPTTFLSKTAHAAQLPNPHPRYAAISNDFSIKNSSCNKNPHPRYAAISNDFSIKNSPTKIPTLGIQRLFYQKQLMQPTKEKK
jgi:hypothetical protein